MKNGEGEGWSAESLTKDCAQFVCLRKEKVTASTVEIKLTQILSKHQSLRTEHGCRTNKQNTYWPRMEFQGQLSLSRTGP